MPPRPLSSRYAVRALGALIQLLSHEAASASLRANAVGAPLRWAPDEGSFADGWQLFATRHITRATPASARQQALHVARSVLALGAVPDRETGDAETGEESPEVWDGARVFRHLERTLGQAYQVLRRASWLCMLANCSVAYREPGAEHARFLQLANAELLESGDLEPATELRVPGRRARCITQLAFDAARYDSLRVLTTELKRILRDGGEVQIRLSRSCLLTGPRLERLLRLV